MTPSATCSMSPAPARATICAHSVEPASEFLDDFGVQGAADPAAANDVSNNRMRDDLSARVLVRVIAYPRVRGRSSKGEANPYD